MGDEFSSYFRKKQTPIFRFLFGWPFILLYFSFKKILSPTLLRDGPDAYETLAKLEGVAKENEGGKYIDYHFEASEYEKKLIQVAEMHGELLEFNENLQKNIQNKDTVISRLKDELISLRGPLPDDDDRITGRVINGKF